MTPDQAEAYRRSGRLRFPATARSLNHGRDEIKLLKDNVRYFLSKLTFEDRTNLPKEVADRLLNDIVSQFSSDPSRMIMLEEVVAIAPDLLQHPDRLTRLNTMLILIQLSAKPADLVNRKPPIPYVPVFQVLVDVLQDTNQNLDCRILAARGLARVCELGSPSAVERSRIATALVNTLKQNPPSSNEGIQWFRLRMTQALGLVDRLDDVATAPIVIDTLMGILTDPQETWLTRSEASRGVSQLPFNGSTNVPLITYSICKLLDDMSGAYKNQSKAPNWRRSFTNIYLSFRPQTTEDAKTKNWGLLYQVNRPGVGAHRAIVEEAFAVVFPVTSPVITSKPPRSVPDSARQELQDWLEKNVPENLRPTPQSEPIGKPQSDEPVPMS